MGNLTDRRDEATDGTALKAEIETLKEREVSQDKLVAFLQASVAELASVCVCGCPIGEHENYGEDGESCENDDHDCIRTSASAAKIINDLRDQLTQARQQHAAQVETLREALEMLLDRTANPITDHCAYTLADARKAGYQALAQLQPDPPAPPQRIEILERALDRIASWEEGPEVDSLFEEPVSAAIARAALNTWVAAPDPPSSHTAGSPAAPQQEIQTLRAILDALVTGDGAQRENLDPVFMRQSMDAIAPDREDLGITVTKATLLAAIAALTAQGDPE